MTTPPTDPMQALIHAEAHAAVSRIAARHDFERDQLDPEVVAECDRYGVTLVEHCAICHAETPDNDGHDVHESWCAVLDSWRIGDLADAAHDRDKDAQVDELWEMR